MLFIDFSFTFNTVIPSKLISKLIDLGISLSFCNWTLDFLTNRPQSVRISNHTSSVLTLNTGVPQGCVLSPILYSLLTHDCIPVHGSNSIIMFADDTTVVGLISGNDETAYRDEVQHLATWCANNNLALNTQKTKELIVDHRRTKKDHTHTPIYIDGAEVERVASSLVSITITISLIFCTFPCTFLPPDAVKVIGHIKTYAIYIPHCIMHLLFILIVLCTFCYTSLHPMLYVQSFALSLDSALLPHNLHYMS